MSGEKDSIWKFLEGALSSSTSALIVSSERSIAAEFPPDAQARNVLTAIGSGERTFSNIGKASGGLQQTSISRSLKILTDKRIVVAELPLSTKSSKETRYRIADPYIRFWLSFLGPNFAEIERGRGDRVLKKFALHGHHGAGELSSQLFVNLSSVSQILDNRM